jgi:hypothetical protein
VAIKILQRDDIIAAGITAFVRNEIAILRRVRHRNVVGLVDVIASETKLYLVLEGPNPSASRESRVQKAQGNESNKSRPTPPL